LSNKKPARSKQLLWFVGLWLMGVGTLAIIGMIIKLWLGI